MSDLEIRTNFSKNVAKLRKSHNLSQSEFAKLFAYSDKAISKWETGETIPDIFTLNKIADYFNIRVDDLISQSNVIRLSNKKLNHLLITIVSAGLCFLVATFAFFFLQVFEADYKLLPFISGAIAASIVLIIFSSLWYKKRIVFLSISLLVWSIALLTMYLMNFYLFWIVIALGLIIEVLFALFLKIKTK